ncbi:MAG: hypothetical protein ACI9J3_004164 [Parvicellaceae bacterium]|jgi:hypothetical protein
MSEVLKLDIESSEPQNSTIEISDIYGKIHWSKKVTLNSGFNHVDINSLDLARGSYICILRNENGQKSYQFIKM